MKIKHLKNSIYRIYYDIDEHLTVCNYLRTINADIICMYWLSEGCYFDFTYPESCQQLTLF